MKKIFMLFAASVAAITLSATEPAEEWSEITFTAPVAKTDLAADAEFTADGFKVAITDPDDKMSIDANSCRFGSATDYTTYTHRLKTGGKSSATKNFITLTLPADGVVRLAVRTGSNSDATRNLIAVQGADTLYNQIIQESMAVKVMEDTTEVSVYPFVEISAQAGTVVLSYPVNGLNFYLFAFKAGSDVPPVVEPDTIPTTAPDAPAQDEADVMAIYCNHYATNNANFAISGWAGAYQTLDLDGTNVGYWTGMTWECIIDPAHTDDAHDFSAYENIHIDMWAPQAAKIKFVAEAVAGGNYKDGQLVDLAQGWNSFDFAIDEWPGNYDFANLKCFVFEQYKTPEDASFEGNPFAFANIYFWKNPAAPSDTIALDFSVGGGYVDNTYFEEYGTTDLVFYNIPVVGNELVGDGEYLVLDFYPENPNDITGTYTIADETLDDYYTYMLVVNGTDTAEVLFTDGELMVSVLQTSVEYGVAQIAVAAQLTGDDGNIYTVSGTFTLYYDFIEIEDGVENVQKDDVQCTKRVVNGQLVIEKNGKAFNLLGAEVR